MIKKIFKLLRLRYFLFSNQNSIYENDTNFESGFICLNQHKLNNTIFFNDRELLTSRYNDVCDYLKVKFKK